MGVEDDLLDAIANNLNADEETDQDVSEKLARLVNKRWSEKLKEHSRPRNLWSLVAARVNPKTWANKSHTAKSVDLRAANTQNIASKVGTIAAKCTDNLLMACEKDAKKIDLDEMVSFHSDALALLGHSQYELSLKRHEAIRPILKREYAALFSRNVPINKTNKILQVSVNGKKSQKTGYKGSSSTRGQHRSSDQYYKRFFHSHNQ